MQLYTIFKYLTMHSTGKMKQPKKILQLWLPTTKSDHSKESLFNGELSDGQKRINGADYHQYVPKGYLGVYVGPHQRRHVIPMSYLSMPDFRVLMDRSVEEFGYEQEGALQIPCEEEEFEEVILRCVAKHQYMSKKKKKKAKNSNKI